ncbi:MAG: DUF5711 family protein [Oscillospiraceae bacterium]|nr:DUF5711 family protein [Oscillospiraceae bacterium]
MVKQPKKKKKLLPRLLAGLVTLALALGAIFLVSNHDQWNLDTLKRRITYRTLERSDTGQAESFSISGSSSDLHCALGDDLLVCASQGVWLYSAGGVCYVDDTVSLSTPAVEVCGDTAAVYDLGGDAVYLYSDRTQVGALTELDGSILSVRLNSKGWMAVTTQDSGYKAIVTIYDSELTQRSAVRLSTSFVVDAVVTEDCGSLAVVTVGQEDTAFESALALYELSSGLEAGVYYDLSPSSILSLGNNLILDLFSGGPTYLVGDSALAIWEDKTVNTWSYQDLHLRDYAVSSQLAAILVSKYQSGNQTQLYLIDSSGESTGSLSLDEQVLSLSAAGRYVAVLTANRLDIYTKDLSLYASLEGTENARTAVMRSDGSVFLIRSDSAQLYVP